MNLRLTSLLLALLTLAACSQQQAPEASTPAATPAATATAPAPAEAAAPAATTDAPAAAPAAAEPEAPNNNPIVPPQGPAPVAGTDYEEIAGGQPYQPLDGKIEVVEVFGYVCPACAAFHPVVSDWEKKLPADVRFTYVPAPFGPEWNPYAKSYYVAESMGLVKRTHDALINAIHVTHAMPGEGDKPDEQKIANFYAGYGANAAQFLAAMNSFAVASKVNRGKQFMMRSGVSSTPTLVINGRYRITGKGWEDKVRIADHLIAMERAKAATGG
ncbi:MAG TPA: thiol:disulfide interchange protein DsbA/DsbL [Lysobacter sp.]